MMNLKQLIGGVLALDDVILYAVVCTAPQIMGASMLCAIFSILIMILVLEGKK